ncbi:MAG: hypothetical protein HOI47_29190 [Candidatus Scalindua sp.]|jgi:hypothetical protein|nr:hypothetical protein [Candidatus Scalindua sp.]
MKMIVEIRGGVVTNLEAEDSISIFIIDHDSLKDGAEPSETRIGQRPFFTGTEAEIDEHITEILSPYEN